MAKRVTVELRKSISVPVCNVCMQALIIRSELAVCSCNDVIWQLEDGNWFGRSICYQWSRCRAVLNYNPSDPLVDLDVVLVNWSDDSAKGKNLLRDCAKVVHDHIAMMEDMLNGQDGVGQLHPDLRELGLRLSEVGL